MIGRNKKGDILDLVYILSLIFVFAIVTAVSYVVWHEWKEHAGQSDAINTSESFMNVSARAESTLAAWDYIFIFFILGLIIITIVASFMIRTHPLFFWVSLFVLIIALVLSAMLSNVWDTFTGRNPFDTFEANYTIIPYVMNNLPVFILFIGAILILIFYAKNKLMEY